MMDDFPLRKSTKRLRIVSKFKNQPDSGRVRLSTIICAIFVGFNLRLFGSVKRFQSTRLDLLLPEKFDGVGELA